VEAPGTEAGGLIGVGCPAACGPVEGSRTPRGEAAPTPVSGVGSTDTHPPWGPRYTSGQTWASAPVTLNESSGPGRPARKPTARRDGIPSSRAMTANAPANCWQ